MAESDMKTISELDFQTDSLDGNSIFPVVANPSGDHNITKKITFPNIKTQILGYELIDVLTAGSTSITISSVPAGAYSTQVAYAVGRTVTNTVDEVTKNYICVKACTAGQWSANCNCFVEYSLIDSNSNIQVFTNPALLYESISVANNAVTITFAEQADDVAVKVRVS